jgi:hypothetical protein
MPGRDGTGPEGRGPRGRRMGPCRDINAPADTEKSAGEPDTGIPATYGVGRGGKPRGCGMGHCGGRRRER